MKPKLDSSAPGHAKGSMDFRGVLCTQGVDTDAALVEKVEAAMRAGEHASIEYITYTKSGAKFWSSLSITPVRSDDGELEHFVGAPPFGARNCPPR